jgi:uncharacterized membrane protein
MSHDGENPVLDRPGLAKGRTEALADGIFAVAMTLLVLDIKSPERRKFETAGDLVTYLAALEHSFAMYVISFVVLAIFWISHHLLFHFVRHVSRRLLWLNIAFLLLVTLVPFSTDLLGVHGHLTLPVLIYGANLLALGSLLVFQLRYLAANPEFAAVEFSPVIVAHIGRNIRLLAAIPIASMAVSLVSPRTGMYLYLLLAIPAFTPSRLDRLLYPDATTRADSIREDS